MTNKGAVAQLGERGLCKPEVVGSIPSSSTRSNLFSRVSRPLRGLGARDALFGVLVP